MQKLSIKDLIDFRRKSEKSKKTFAETFKTSKPKIPPDGGGDYWISCLSAISNSCKSNDLRYITNEAKELEETSTS